ncbi:MAG TPA: Rho termination factor N-terminal domain-containing protein [Solirubrobacteraceae bacterium]|jgi:transcription termination factor Rho|nr:Rho termination factor N-terminal domain-containing protein [Solirubrobacteraceae bacterium]
MAVLERSELEASPLSDLHAIADQLGLDGFRRLRKADLIDAILEESGGAGHTAASDDAEAPEGRNGARGEGRRAPRAGRSRSRGRRGSGAAGARADAEDDGEPPAGEEREEVIAEGSVEVLTNGSGFLRVSPPEPSDEDVYISAAQVRRCELVSGDRVTGPVRAPRRSERYPSLVRIDTINGASADAVAERAPYEDLPAAYPSERLALGSQDPTLAAIEWLTPLGLGSRVVICGAPRSGKTSTLRSLLGVLASREDLEVSVVLAGVRPEEIPEWQEGPVAPSAALSFAASADAQGQALERALDAAKRVASRGGNALVLADGLDGVHPHAARKALAAARNLRDAGSLTLIATAGRPFGGETTVIALDAALTSTGRQPILDLLGSGAVRPELLVGEDGAQAIAKARAAALESAN